jgi:hypothetical protein
MTAFKIREKRVRRGWYIAAALAAGTLTALTLVVGASALAGTTFEAGDGNLVVNGTETDWASPAPNREIGTDLPTGTGDNSFGQGDKEDDPLVHVGDGSIPNSKSDLHQFYVGSEQLGTPAHTFLYLGWTRANSGGTTNFDFEINQEEQPDLTTLGTKTLVRTEGDLLVNYLFQGQGTPQIAIRTWNGSAWSGPVDASAYSEASINSGGEVANPLPGAINPTPQNRFGEVAIDLTAGDLIPPGVCRAFGSAFVKTRSSTSFNSEIKDFIAPIHVNIANCATIIVEKVTVPSPDPTDTSFAFVSDFDGNFSLKNGESRTKADLNPGTYSVSETPVPANWVLTSETCSDGSDPQAIDLGPSETVTCTFTNTLQLGAILITKTTKIPGQVGPQPQPGVAFSIDGTSVGTTNSSGQICVDGLTLASHSVAETVPAGYQADQANPQSVVVDNSADCDDVPYVGETVGFSNTPLTDVVIKVTSQATGGTSNTVDCDNNSLDDLDGGNVDQTETGLLPQTINCQIVIDP